MLFNTARLTPLWICVEDTSIGYRLWITQTSASALHISYVKIDAQGKLNSNCDGNNALDSDDVLRILKLIAKLVTPDQMGKAL